MLRDENEVFGGFSEEHFADFHLKSFISLEKTKISIESSLNLNEKCVDLRRKISGFLKNPKLLIKLTQSLALGLDSSVSISSLPT